jgi:hypothetical protein
MFNWFNADDDLLLNKQLYLTFLQARIFELFK